MEGYNQHQSTVLHHTSSCIVWYTARLNLGPLLFILHINDLPAGLKHCKVSMLGPLLFILHINYLPAGLKHCKVSMYAVDTLLYCEGTDLNEICIKVNEDLQYVKTWLDHNKLSLNVNKTEYMLLGTRNRLNKINDK